ncbi:MAG: TatD family hydrolase [Candidatus Gracilibacteria bacterium]|nr:TatD family hydrolase [Candidatus Gracilibacteria bacterium]
MLIDSHTHLDFPEFDADREAVIASAKSLGVEKFINPGCNLATSRKAVELASRFPEIYAGVGIHPHDAAEVDANSLVELARLAANKKVVAIGEIGLDYFRMKNSKEIQIAAFENQLALAEKIGKPVIIHSREADTDIFECLDKFPNLKGVFHCFGGDWNFAQEVLSRGFYIGITAIVTYPNAQKTQEVAQKIPLDRLLIETDSPFLAPQSKRGKRCNPADVAEVAERIAQLKNIPVVEVTNSTALNAQNLFALE